MIKVRKLKCGIRIVMDKTEFVQSAAVGIWVKAGSFNESSKNSGISHYIEHMMFKGTEKRSAKQIAEDVDKIGGQINAFTSKEATCYYIKSLSANLKTSMEILTDMINNSVFDKEELKRERQVICEEIKMIEDTPDDYAHEMIAALINKGNQFEKTIIGTPSSLNRISRNTILKYIDEEYTKDSLLISIAGNFDEEEVCAYFEGKFDRFKDKKESEQLKDTYYQPRYKLKVKNIEQSHIFLGIPGIALGDEDYYKFQIVGSILGGSMSSRLFQSVRERKGLAYSVYSANSSNSRNGMFLIYAAVAHENVKAAVDEIKNQLTILKEEGILEEELMKAKEQMKASIIFGLENISSKMFAIGRNLLLTDRIKSEEEILAEIDSITLDETRGAIELISDFANYSCAAVTNRKINLSKIMES